MQKIKFHLRHNGSCAYLKQDIVCRQRYARRIQHETVGD